MPNIHPIEDEGKGETIVLKVKIHCCTACPEKLIKGLKRIQGVDSVEVDPTNDLVTITSVPDTVLDPEEIIQKTKKMGKTAKLIPSNDQDDHHHHMEKEKTCENVNAQRKGPSCSHDNNGKKGSKEDSKGNQYKCHGPPVVPQENVMAAAAGPREFPEHICRDIYCRIHRRDSIIFDRFPQMYYNPVYNGVGRMSYPIRGSSPFMAPPPPPSPYGGARMMQPPFNGGGDGYMPRGMPWSRDGGYY